MTKQTENPEPERALRPGHGTARIAIALNSLSSSPLERAVVEGSTDAPERITPALIEAVINARALRSAYFPHELLGDPAWDMMLELLHAELTHRRVTPAILSKAAGVRIEVGLRWINALARKNICSRPDGDPQNAVVRLSSNGSRSLRAFFEELCQQPNGAVF